MLEYLVAATFISLSNITTAQIGQAALRPQNSTTPVTFGPPTLTVVTRPVPEPGTALLLAAAAAAGALFGRRRRR